MNFLLKLFTIFQLVQSCLCFTIGPQPAVSLNRQTTTKNDDRGSSTLKHHPESTGTDTTTPELKLSESEQNVYNFLEELHNSDFDFRIVVVGNGAILETTAPLGPNMKVSESPATPGQHLVTFASEDASFEFHVKIGQVSKVAIVEKKVSDIKTLRILRMINDDTGKSICSLILADQSSEAAGWFQSMMAKHGSEMQF
ncbi:unnamed protein product [Cylindrotheca closterium]|uniref:Uncharacterized protein n=1 Tax=Cylindrotheca closterium TaxID=2856 RepID=A0AAD2FZD3_9STRA|nr:unnamed protein product [Cylindrotheca closterium]